MYNKHIQFNNKSTNKKLVYIFMPTLFSQNNSLIAYRKYAKIVSKKTKCK